MEKRYKAKEELRRGEGENNLGKMKNDKIKDDLRIKNKRKYVIQLKDR